MKKVTSFLRFLALVFFILLALAVCFVFNSVLDKKIEKSHSQALESIINNNEDIPTE